MDYQQVFSRSKALANIPERKLQERLLALTKVCKTSSHENKGDGLCSLCSIRVLALNRYFNANIPLEYWSLQMDKFAGAPELKSEYVRLINRIDDVYMTGESVCFGGSHGLGKSLSVANILKWACLKNYACLYTTLADIVSAIIESSYEDKFLARRELMTVDFLAVDEFDSRFMLSEGSAELFGKILEHILRTRMQNKLPTLFCTNSPNPTEAFSGAIKQSMESLMSRVKFVPVIGKDYRKINAI